MKKLQGYLSCVLVAKDVNDLNNIRNFLPFLAQMHESFETVICTTSGKIDPKEVKSICDSFPNLAVYEISSTAFDELATAGLEISLGDWIMELTDCQSLEKDARELIDALSVDNFTETLSYQLTPQKPRIIDRALSRLASLALGVPVHTLTYTSRLSKRTALQTWNARKLRSKVLRVAPQLSYAIVQNRKSSRDSRPDYARIIRVGIRTIAHSSAKPLRWISSISMMGAVLSMIVSASVVAVGINNKVVPGWTTTNLQISGLSFLILSVLGILTEYIYQIAASAIDQPAFRITNETLSPRYTFLESPNISTTYDS